ncbi:MAG: hypothetical protein IJN63_07585 [Clostridia bacterium]|nr:hypothetical protein [Clostridia bacterium]
MKKIICLLLIACTLIPLLVACGGGGNTVVTTEPPKDDDPVVTTAPTTTEYVEMPELPDDPDYDGYEFLVLVSGNYKVNDFEASEDSSDIISQAIWRRNVMLDDQMGVVIANKDIIAFGSSTGKGGAGFKAMQQSYTTNSFDYDMCMIGSYDAGVIAYSGFATDLNTLPYVDLERSWWDQRATADLEISGKMFYTTGDIGLCDNRVTHCLLFNKGLIAEDPTLVNPYELVREGKWTFDAMATEVSKVSVDVNADDKMDYQDKYGLLTWNDSFSAAVAAGGNKLCTINEDGVIEITFYNDRMETIADKYTSMVFDSQTAFNYQYNIGQANWDTYRHAMFRESRCLYYMQTLTAVSTFRDDDLDFGIIPYPKLNEEQENYNSLVSVYHAQFVMVPTFMEDEDRTGAVVEALAYYGKQLLTPAYFEKTLVGREMRDEDSEEMLYVIFDNRVYDVGLIYNVGNLKNILTNCLSGRKNNISSQWNTYKKPAERNAKTINEELAKISQTEE